MIPNCKIVTVTPGKLTRYINQDKDAFSVTTTSFASNSSAICYRIIPTILKLNIKQLKVSKVCVSYIKRELRNANIYIKLKWTFFDFEEFITSPEKLGQNNKIKLDFTTKYRIEIDQKFMAKLSDTPISFELYAVSEKKEILLSKTNYFIENFCETVNSKIDARIMFTNNIINTTVEGIAHMDICYKFTCNQTILKSLYLKSKPDSGKNQWLKMDHLLNDRFIQKSKNLDAVHVTVSECDAFADGLLLVLNRNKVLKTTQSEISNELEERVRWLRYEANWKQTLQENAILHGKNPEDVNWRQWREEDTANIRLRTYSQQPEVFKPEITITIKKLMFFKGSSPLRDDSIQQIYVEYTFLNQEGPEMETPFSLPKPKPEEEIVFDFSRTFPIDLEQNYAECKILANMIRDDGKITFMVISEPLENLETPIQTCKEIGYAEVHFNELTQMENNVDVFEYEIVDINNPIEVIGFLTIEFEGILAMRKMALLFLAPKHYNLYM